MRFTHLLGAAALAASFPAAASAQWSILVPESEYLVATGRADMDSAEITTDGNGKFLCIDTDNSANHTLLLLDPSLAVGSQAQIVLDASSITTAVNAANGSAADYVPASVRFQNIQYNAAGDIIVYVDDGTNQAALLKVAPAPPFTINVLSCAVDAGTSPVEGGNGMITIGNTAYLLVERSFGGAEDSILSVDTGPTVNDGSAAATFVIGEADLLPATGQTAADYRHSRAVPLSSTQFLLVNSGLAASNDDILLITVGSPSTAEPYILATAIETAIGATDVGFNGIAIDGNGALWLANAFGAGATDDGVVIITSRTSPSDITATIDLEATIATEVGGTDLFQSDNCLVWDPSANRIAMFSGGVGTEGILVKSVAVSSVQDWSVID